MDAGSLHEPVLAGGMPDSCPAGEKPWTFSIHDVLASNGTLGSGAGVGCCVKGIVGSGLGLFVWSGVGDDVQEGQAVVEQMHLFVEVHALGPTRKPTDQ